MDTPRGLVGLGLVAVDPDDGLGLAAELRDGHHARAVLDVRQDLGHAADGVVVVPGVLLAELAVGGEPARGGVRGRERAELGAAVP
ncbi:hypothetical protein EBZ39_18340 [bacterium]|nr:hypothetical protein [bacterium]